MGVEISAANLSEAALQHNFTNEGGVDGTYRLLKNVVGMWLLQQLKRAFDAAGGNRTYADLVQLAEQATPLRSLINPDAAEFLRPTNMVAAIQEYCRRSGQPIPDTEGALVRCALESLAVKYREIIKSLEMITGESIEVIHIVGGGSRNALLNQFTADVCQRPVVAGPVEATALGNVLCQARALGELHSLAEIRSIIRESFSHEVRDFQPNADSLAEWEDATARLRLPWA